ncbi:multicopper oxidase-domain-containing protein [Macrophomina phaseolina]|uniref:Multicopper oxidase-domain-containing protein n=1 Tax=Macrophomina phaseolina TaxID=35725 RepID=A0ABQ8FPQ0_9PEZI|nr:multicopper oxidase-domain-containing protein [Macrophomina phaseolina]
MHQYVSFLALTFLLLSQSRRSQAELRTYKFTIHNGTRAPDGFPRQVYLINDQAPGPLIEVDEGDDLEVFVQNDLAVETTIHWHGILQQGTPHMDGVPGVTQEPIPPGGNFTYRFSLNNEYGFYWYHSHFRAYSDDAIRGPLVIHPSSQRPRPYETLARNQTELTALQEAEREAVPILLSDWYHRVSDDIFNEYLTTGAFPSCVDSLLANGYGRVRCLPEYILAAGAGLGMEPAPINATATSVVTTPMSFMAMSTKSMETNTKESMRVESMALETMSMEHHMRRMDSMSAEDTSMNTMTAHSMPASAPDSGMPMSSMSMASLPVSGILGTSGLSGMSNTASGPLGPRGCSAPMMFRPGYNISSLPPECNERASASKDPNTKEGENLSRGFP